MVVTNSAKVKQMTLAPDITERLARARADLRMGVPVVMQCPQNGSALVFAAETLDANRLAHLRTMGGDPIIVVTNWRAQTLKTHAYDGDISRIFLPRDVSLPWISGIADPADDLKTPMKGPFKLERGGTADLHRAAIKLVKSARLLPAVVMLPVDNGSHIATKFDLTSVPLASHAAFDGAPDMAAVVSARLPLEVSESGRLHVFRPSDGTEEHYAVEIGQPARNTPVLARLHSACVTGDLMGSLKCDCGPQLRGALSQMGTEGAGILLYLNQEGRGIGLANKMRAYSLQDQGFDTVEANHRLGFEDDERDFRIGSEILRNMGFSSVRLLTNNPNKIARMRENGIEVSERVALKVGENRFNKDYLATKADKSGHLL